MVGIASTADSGIGGGDLIAVFECGLCEGAPGLYLKSVSSADDGKTWRNRADVYKAKGSGSSQVNAGAPQVANVGGKLVSSFMTDEDDAEAGKWPVGSAMKVVGGEAKAQKVTLG
ncbi:MAG: hypothetical protein M1831_002533 [Alyxoria varia]|nr:MAG: hypothetical protein M1831_002533 [Alyxoria varia]